MVSCLLIEFLPPVHREQLTAMFARTAVSIQLLDNILIYSNSLNVIAVKDSLCMSPMLLWLALNGTLIVNIDQFVSKGPCYV